MAAVFLHAHTLLLSFPFYLRNPIKPLESTFTSGIEKNTMFILIQQTGKQARQAFIK